MSFAGEGSRAKTITKHLVTHMWALSTFWLEKTCAHISNLYLGVFKLLIALDTQGLRCDANFCPDLVAAWPGP